MAPNPNDILPRHPSTEPLRVVFFGTPGLAVPTLDALLAAPDVCEVVAVVAQPDRPAGRGKKLRAPPVAARATELGLDLRQPRGVRRGPFPRRFAELKPDVAVVIAYGRILTAEVLQTPRYGCVNVHASLLPKYRGAGPIQWSIIEGESESGVTTMWMEEGLDTGPMLQVAKTPLSDSDTAATLGARVSAMGAELAVSTLRAMQAGTLQATPQPGGWTHAPLLTKEDGRIRWGDPALQIDRRRRGTTPWPGAFCTYRGRTMKVHGAEILGAEACGIAAAPGTVVSTGDGGIVVACGAGALRLTEVQPPGKRAMSAADFLRGYDLDIGESLAASEP
jgi:methionyl-tRNA formyltransferase